MNLAIFKTLAEKARKVKWGKTANLDGRTVEVVDVDLNGKISPSTPLSATVRFREAGRERVIVGTFWPRDMQEENVSVDGKQWGVGKVSLAGKYSFPASVKIKLRFRFGNASEKEHEFLVTGKAGAGILDFGDLF